MILFLIYVIFNYFSFVYYIVRDFNLPVYRGRLKCYNFFRFVQTYKRDEISLNFSVSVSTFELEVNRPCHSDVRLVLSSSVHQYPGSDPQVPIYVYSLTLPFCPSSIFVQSLKNFTFKVQGTNVAKLLPMLLFIYVYLYKLV